MIWVRLLTIAIALWLVGPTFADAKTDGRYASIIVDADRLEVLHARQIDAQRHPASLTKIMTLYLTFEALERGDIRFDSSFNVSSHAARTPPVKMGLRRGQSVTIDTLVQAVAVRSANDAAVVLAEAIAGSEENFVARMNAAAASLGMRQTVFRNPHGLPDDQQVTTARDMAKLAHATLTRFPQHYHLFGQTHFRGRKNTNKLLTERDDVDGFKTGYTRASGYNLVISATRDDRRIIAVVLGGASSDSRNTHMSDLIDRGFEVMHSLDAPVIAAHVQTQPTQNKHNWALQIDGFDSPAETAILADTLVRHAGIGEVRERSIKIDNKSYYSVRVDALDNRTARSLCAQSSEILQITPRQCKVLSVINPS